MTAEGRDRGNLRFVNPPELAAPPGYTHVVEATGGRTVYLSGQVALDPSGELVGAGDLEAQARQVFENLKAALGAVGAGFEDVVKLTYYVADPPGRAESYARCATSTWTQKSPRPAPR